MFTVFAEDETKNVYFGDLHVHSSLSFDSYIFGNRLSLDQSYRVAKGEAVENVEGEIMQLRTPLDFAAITDHSESFGIHEGCDDEEATLATMILCRRLESPDLLFFLQLRANGAKRPPDNPMLDAAGDHEKLHKFAKMTWDKIIEVNNIHNDPGKFTTFHAYEYSPTLPDVGKHHRNVIFRNDSVPDHAVSMFHAATEIDLWKQLDDLCLGNCQFITIPHNSNLSWGLAFANITIDGDPYDLEAWKLRDQFEPIVEMFQVKGSSECAIGFGTTDEECNIEQHLTRCEPGQETQCIHPTSMVRDGLKLGLQYKEEIGFNPMDFGFIGSTDTHNSNPGDTEEYDFRGASGVFTAPAETRLSNSNRVNNTPGGLAAIWADQNTRDALFDSMQRKEVYATSGTRIRLKFSVNFESQQETHPMGSTVKADMDNMPEFSIVAQKDPLEGPLHKVQLIKGWTSNGIALERVLDIYCSQSCSDEVFKVDLKTCEIDQQQGEDEIKVSWTDETYKPEQNAFYYVRVLQVPTCRWSTYDSIALGIQPPDDIPATVTEMAWSSPIWIDSANE